jgi:multidrug resistance protein, MATE family
MHIVKQKDFILKGGLKELAFLFFPIFLITFSNGLFLLTEKLLLSRFSLEAMEAAINANYAIQIFQAATIALAMMTQVCVGRWWGANQRESIGPGVWQFIWFSLFSLFITLPLSLAYEKFYFQGTDLKEIVRPYFYSLASFNFLYPLGATLSSFYIGQGKTRLVLCVTMGSQLIKLILAYLFIFGWVGLIPSLGLLGGALSTFIAQFGFCLLLFLVFLNSKHAVLFQSRKWRFQPKLFWECIQPGLLRAANRILNMSSWASIAHLMVAKGGDYLLLLSIGGTLFVFLPFLGEALCQAQTTVISNILGAGNIQFLNRALRSGSFLVLMATALISIPLFFFPSTTFHYLFPNIFLEEVVIQHVFFGLWVSFTFFTFGSFLISYILAFKDTKFSLFMGGVNWINGFLLMYVAIEKIHIPADQFWLTLSLMHGSTVVFYYWRIKWLQSQLTKKAIAVGA